MALARQPELQSERVEQAAAAATPGSSPAVASSNAPVLADTRGACPCTSGSVCVVGGR